MVADFSGGTLSTDGGALLLRQIDQALGLSRTLAACFYDARDGRFIDHTVEELNRQRLYGLALGYEDLNDHDQLRRDPLPPPARSAIRWDGIDSTIQALPWRVRQRLTDWSCRTIGPRATTNSVMTRKRSRRVC